MYIVYRDGGGYVLVSVDEYGIAIGDGIAYFGDGQKEYQIPVSAVVEIRASGG